MKRVCQIDGGSIRGLIALETLAHIERETNKSCCELFDMFVGTSVGSIIAGVLASGRINAISLSNIMKNEIYNIFDTNFFRRAMFFTRLPKYKMENIERVLNRYLGDIKMSDCESKFVCTSLCVNDGRNHYFKSWEKNDGELILKEAIMKSCAAPMYFGLYHDDKQGKTWADGGTGDSNCSLDEAIIESFLHKEWSSEDIYILSLGCGYHNKSIDYDDSKKMGNIKSVSYYLSISDGGRARIQSTRTKIKMGKVLSKFYDRLNVYRFDTAIPEEMNTFDDLDYVDDYIRIGKELSKQFKMKEIGL